MTGAPRLGKPLSSHLKEAAFSVLPTAMRVQGRAYLRNYLLDIRDRITGNADPDVPLRHLNISGDGPFREYGRNIVDLCVRQAGLTPDDAVVDIGCGIGRTALALTEYLARPARYEGFDLIRFAIRWCQAHITARHPGFSFVHADVYNKFYNPRGRLQAERYRFPFEEESFTFALATSLFTHVLPATARNYLEQIRRVLKPGGRFLSTWFLLDGASPEGAAKMPFPHRFEGCALHSLHAPEQAVAYLREFVEASFAEAGLRVEGIYRGDWSGLAADACSMQDVIVARRG